MDQYCDVLPSDDLAPAYPYTGFVLNFNVTTSIHRDWKDLSLCCVLVISSEDCQGGDLCFEELGVVLGLKSGDMVLFNSSKLSHFNLEYEGERCSVVFHSDSGLNAWLHNNRNGWGDSAYIQVSTNQDQNLNNQNDGRKGG